MRKFALYHDKENVENSNVMNEEEVMALSAHYGNSVDDDVLTFTDEMIDEALDYLLEEGACVKIEELSPDKDLDRAIRDYYIKEQNEL